MAEDHEEGAGRAASSRTCLVPGFDEALSSRRHPVYTVWGMVEESAECAAAWGILEC